MIKIKKIKESFKRLVWIIGEKAIIVFFILFFLALILGDFIFYKYSFLVKKSEPKIIKSRLRFKETIFQKVLKEWKIRQEKFEGAESKEYPNLFQSKVSIPKESEELTK